MGSNSYLFNSYDNFVDGTIDISSIRDKRRLKLVAIHLGAGNLNSDFKQEELARSICEQVMSQEAILPKQPSHSCSQDECHLNSTLYNQYGNDQEPFCTAEEAVIGLIKLMENNDSLNCGTGSNLNMDGQVECDASLMSAKTQTWTGVGAVSGCRNPILLAKSLYDHSTVLRPLGLVQPNFLVGSGARQWMKEHCRDLLIPQSHLISSESLTKYQKYKSRYDSAVKQEFSAATRSNEDEPHCSNETGNIKMDTVGAIAVDCNNNLACAISSGGIMLKHKSRVGQASVPGAGCWAQDSTAVTTTGVGEYLTTILFAKLFHDKLQRQQLLSHLNAPQDNSTIVDEAIVESFTSLLNSPALNHVHSARRLAGLLTVNAFDNDKQASTSSGYQIENENKKDFFLSFGHNSKTMCVGYMTRNDDRATSKMSRMDTSQSSVSISSSPISMSTIKFSL